RPRRHAHARVAGTAAATAAPRDARDPRPGARQPRAPVRPSRIAGRRSIPRWLVRARSADDTARAGGKTAQQKGSLGSARRYRLQPRKDIEHGTIWVANVRG